MRGQGAYLKILFRTRATLHATHIAQKSQQVNLKLTTNNLLPCTYVMNVTASAVVATSKDCCSRSDLAFETWLKKSEMSSPNRDPNCMTMAFCKVSYFRFTLVWIALKSTMIGPNSRRVSVVSNVARLCLLIKRCRDMKVIRTLSVPPLSSKYPIYFIFFCQTFLE